MPMNLKNFSKKQYIKFSNFPGSEYIASEFALLQILKFISRYKIENFLEVGVGIGTISDSVIKLSIDKNLSINCYGTEANDFCLKEIPKNLKLNLYKLILFDNVSEIKNDVKFDLIVVDGKESALNILKKHVTKHSIIMIEGDRSEQTALIKKLFPNSKLAHLISIDKNGSYSKKDHDHYQGGVKVIFTNPTTFQYLQWAKYKIVMKLKYLKRDYFS